MTKLYVLIVVNLVMTKDKCFKLIGYPTHWEESIHFLKCNETGHIARDCPKNDENRKAMRKIDSRY